MVRNFFRFIVAWCLKTEARIYIWRFHPAIVAVAGIGNKTATKNAIAEKFRALGIAGVHVHPKSYNTDIGLPLAILMIEPQSFSPLAWITTLVQATARVIVLGPHNPRILVVEYGVSEPGDMRTLVGIARPDTVVITDVVDHPQSGVTANELVHEMATLIQALSINATLIINVDMPYVSMLMAKAKKFTRIITYGYLAPADYYAESVVEDVDGISYRLHGANKKINKYGKHQLYASLAAEAVVDNYHEVS